tara:strand:+ start:3376 stop:3948 length:573 start_codon:yes stop_codon:yes gene_type:complete
MQTNSNHFFKNQFLIATPALDQGVFKSSVTYICQHDDSGAMGVIINRPSDLKIDELLSEDYSSESLLSTQPVMVGGPIDLERGFILHQNLSDEPRWRSTLEVSDKIALTSSKDILEALNIGQGPQQFMFVLGYAGWAPGQLEEELQENTWLVSPASEEIIFSTPFHLRANAAAKLLGVNFSALASAAGHA